MRHSPSFLPKEKERKFFSHWADCAMKVISFWVLKVKRDTNGLSLTRSVPLVKKTRAILSTNQWLGQWRFPALFHFEFSLAPNGFFLCSNLESWVFKLTFCDIHAKRVSNGPLQLLWSKSTGRKPRGISEPTNTAGLVVLVSPVAIAGRYFGSTGE